MCVSVASFRMPEVDRAAQPNFLINKLCREVNNQTDIASLQRNPSHGDDILHEGVAV